MEVRGADVGEGAGGDVDVGCAQVSFATNLVETRPLTGVPGLDPTALML